MNSRLIDIAKSLDEIGPRLRGALADRVLELLWRAGIRDSKGEGAGLPLGAEPGKPSYWIRRETPRQPKDRYSKQY